MRNTRATLSALALTSIALIGGSHAYAQDAPAAAAAPAAATPAPGIVINGVIEANLTYNLNKPANHENYNYYFNRKAGQFALNLAEIQISKAATPDSRAGFTVKLIEGEVKRYNFAAEDADSTNILEAYGTLLIPAGGKDLKVDVGQFETHVGYETVEIGSNNFFSHNYLFGIPAPFYDAGVRASYPVSSKFTLNGYIYNRYNGRTDAGNNDLAPGFQAVFTISPASSLVLNGLYSRENLGTAAAPINRPQGVLDLIYSNQITTKTKLAVEGLYRSGKDASTTSKDGEDYTFFGVAGYGIFGIGSGNIGLRGEYLKDTKNNFMLGGPAKSNLGSVTLSYEPKMGLFPGVRTIVEYRYDYASEHVFPKKSGSDPSKNESTITLGQIYSF